MVSDITLDLSLVNKKKNAKGVYVRREISYKDFKFNQDEIEAELDKKPDSKTIPTIKTQDNNYWEEKRHEKRNSNYQRTSL